MSGPEQNSSSDSRKLTLFDAVAMAIGGMVGGGIFAVLGQAVRLTGNAAWISFALAGALAFITGVSYSRLTLDFDEPGGSFIFVEEVTGPHIAGSLSWLLMLGYVFTISLYAYTFGAYGSGLFNLGKWAHPYAGCGIIAGLTGLNLPGDRTHGLSHYTQGQTGRDNCGCSTDKRIADIVAYRPANIGIEVLLQGLQIHYCSVIVRLDLL